MIGLELVHRMLRAPGRLEEAAGCRCVRAGLDRKAGFIYNQDYHNLLYAELR